MIRLSRSTPLRTFDVEATVAVGRDRPEFLAVARLAADLGRPIGARDVLQQLIGPLPEILGSRVIERCIGLGLLERSGNDAAKLSIAGQTALERGEVLVPEERVWRFFIVDDPLVQNSIIHVQSIDVESVFEARSTAKQQKAQGHRSREAEQTPEILKHCTTELLPLQSLHNGHLFNLLSVSDAGVAGPVDELTVVLSWASEPMIQISGALPSSHGETHEMPVDATLPIPDVVARLNRVQLWQTLVAKSTGVSTDELERWHQVAGGAVVPAALSTTTPTARHTFLQDLMVPSTTLVDLGQFDATTIDRVDLVPATDDDAQAWLNWLQWEAIDDYVTPALLDEIGRVQIARFPHHNPRVASHAELLDRARADIDERAWFVLGPFDLGLWS